MNIRIVFDDHEGNHSTMKSFHVGRFVSDFWFPVLSDNDVKFLKCTISHFNGGLDSVGPPLER